MKKVVRLNEKDIERLVRKIMTEERKQVTEKYNMDEMMTEAKKKKQEKFIQKAQKSIEKRGTEGSFKEYCGGEVTMACINKAMKSGDTDLVRKANYAKNIGGYKGAKHKK